jgi:hypothetical protein
MSIKNLLPYEKYLMTTKLPISEVYKRLEDNIEPKQFTPSFRSGKNQKKPYSSDIINNTIVMKRIINYRNALHPIITIKTTSLFGETHLEIIIKLPGSGKFFILGWLVLGVSNILILILTNSHHSQQTHPAGLFRIILPSFAIIFIGILLPYLLIKYEGGKSKRFFENLLNAQQIN